MKNITYRELLQTLKDYEGSPCDDILDQPIIVKIENGAVQETHYVNNNAFDGRYMLVAEYPDQASVYYRNAVDAHMDHLAELVARDMDHYRCSDGHSPVTPTAVLDRNRDERFIGHELPSGWPLYLNDYDFYDSY